MTTRVLVPAERADEARGWLEPGPDAEDRAPPTAPGWATREPARRAATPGPSRRLCRRRADLAGVEDGGAQAAAVSHCLERAGLLGSHVGAGVTKADALASTSPTRKR